MKIFGEVINSSNEICRSRMSTNLHKVTYIKMDKVQMLYSPLSYSSSILGFVVFSFNTSVINIEVL